MTHTISIENLGSLVDIRSGYSFKGAIKADTTGDVTVVQVKDLQAREPIDWDKCARVAKGRMMDEARLRKGMLIFSAKGTRNFAWHIHDEPAFAVTNSLFHVITVRSDKITPAFLAWQINQPKAQAWLDNASAGVTVQNIRISSLKELPIVVPSIEVQHSVTAYESAAVAERKTLNALIEIREREMRLISTNVLSGKWK